MVTCIASADKASCLSIPVSKWILYTFCDYASCVIHDTSPVIYIYIYIHIYIHIYINIYIYVYIYIYMGHNII